MTTNCNGSRERSCVVENCHQCLGNLFLTIAHKYGNKNAEVASSQGLKYCVFVVSVASNKSTRSKKVNNLGLLLKEQGKLEEAEVLSRRALEGSERVLGVDHPDTLNSVNKLGSLLQDQGKLEEAEVLFRRALEGKERVLGVDHPHTLTSMYNLAGLLEQKGDLSSAESFARRSLEGYASRNMTTDVEDGVNQLTGILQAQNKTEEASAIEEQYR